MKIPIYDPKPEYNSLKDGINESIQAVLSHGQFILGPEVRKFEKRATQYLGVKHAIGVNSGTDALVIALRSLGIRCRRRGYNYCHVVFCYGRINQYGGRKTYFCRY